MAHIACYLSSHGYGHAVRSAAIIDEIARCRPDARVHVITGAPCFLFAQVCRERKNVHLRSVATDFGLVQKDPRFFSLQETAERLESLITDAGSLIEREREFLVRENIAAVWCDLPFLPFESARREGIPAVGLGNFSWDWVYEYYRSVHPAFGHAAELAAACYQTAGLYLKLPFSPPAPAFPLQEEIPLACRSPRLERAEVRRMLKLGDSQRVVLIAFSGLSLSASARARLESIPETVFLIPAPMQLEISNGISVPAGEPDFASLCLAADVLVTKPGYGIVTDAITCDTPIVYTDRGDFPEVPWLEQLIRHSLGGASLAMTQFEEGDWEGALQAAVDALNKKRQDGQSRMRTDGTPLAAQRFLGFCGA